MTSGFFDSIYFNKVRATVAFDDYGLHPVFLSFFEIFLTETGCHLLFVAIALGIHSLTFGFQPPFRDHELHEAFGGL